jgi:hypothetical protein
LTPGSDPVVFVVSDFLSVRTRDDVVVHLVAGFSADVGVKRCNVSVMLTPLATLPVFSADDVMMIVGDFSCVRT